MNLCVVELTTTPADERLNHQGVALRVELSYDKAGGPRRLLPETINPCDGVDGTRNSFGCPLGTAHPCK